MTYSEFVKIYPALDLFLELFKGLGPTLIAILAIVLNHRNSVKRDKENRRNSLYYTVQKEMLDKFLELSQLQWKCGANLIDLLSKQDAGRGEDIQEIYSPVLYNMQFKAQEIKDYYHSMFESFGMYQKLGRSTTMYVCVTIVGCKGLWNYTANAYGANAPTKVDRNQIVCMPIEIRNIQDDQQVREGIENCIRMTKYSLGIRK